MLAKIVEHFIDAKAQYANLPDILPRVIAIAKTLPDSKNKSVALKKVAVGYATQGQYDCLVSQLPIDQVIFLLRTMS